MILLRAAGAFLEWRIRACGAGMMGLLFPIVSAVASVVVGGQFEVEAVFYFALQGEVAEFAEDASDGSFGSAASRF